MKLTVTRVNVWAAEIEDKPGALAEKLAVLSDAGANLAFVLSRRAPELPMAGVVFLTPLKGPRQIRAARKVGFLKADGLYSIQVEGTDRPGTGVRITQALADAGLNLRGYSAAVVSKCFVAYLALDAAADAAKAARILRKLK